VEALYDEAPASGYLEPAWTGAESDGLYAEATALQAAVGGEARNPYHQFAGAGGQAHAYDVGRGADSAQLYALAGGGHDEAAAVSATYALAGCSPAEAPAYAQACGGGSMPLAAAYREREPAYAVATPFAAEGEEFGAYDNTGQTDPDYAEPQQRYAQAWRPARDPEYAEARREGGQASSNPSDLGESRDDDPAYDVAWGPLSSST
jgi:hypothetical protein